MKNMSNLYKLVSSSFKTLMGHIC